MRLSTLCEPNPGRRRPVNCTTTVGGPYVVVIIAWRSMYVWFYRYSAGMVIRWYIIERRISNRDPIQRKESTPKRDKAEQQQSSRPVQKERAEAARAPHQEARRTRARTGGVSGRMFPSVDEKISRMFVWWRRKMTKYSVPRFCKLRRRPRQPVCLSHELGTALEPNAP